MFKDLKIMKTNIITNNTNMKRYLKYLCAVLLLIGTSAHAWATVTDTFDDFSNCGWGFSTSAYTNGTYSLGKLTLVGEIKASTYDDCIMLDKRNGGGSVTLPSFDGTVSKIKLYTHSNCDGTYNTEVGVYVNGVMKTIIILNRSTTDAQYTFSPVVAKGAVITLHNESSNAVVQLTQIEVTHEGAAISSGANSITKFNEPADGGTFTCTVGGNEVSSAAEDAIVQLTATPNSGYTLSGFVVTGNYGYCSYGTYVPWTEKITVNGSNQFTMPDGNVTVEALWEETVTYTVTYDRSKALCAQNGSGSWPTNATGLTSGTVQALPTDIELNGVDGYTFAGWTTNGSYSSSSTAPSPLYTTNVTVTSNITLYPVFSQSGSTGASVTFNAQSGGIAAGYYVFCYGQSGTQNALGSELNTTTYKLDPVGISVTSSTSSVTDRKAMWQIEASGNYWTIKNVYTGKYVALKRDGSNNIQNNKVDMVSSVTNDAKWTFEVQSDHYYVKSAADANYFLRYYGKENIWNINNGSNPNNNGGSLYLYKSTSTPAAATSTYTIQPPCTTYTLTYNGNTNTTGSVPASATEYASGAIVTVKGNSGELAKPGYDFNGWKTSASSGTAYAAGSNITMTQNYTLYAQWLAHTISLVLDANGGETNGSASVKYDGTELEAGMVGVTGLTGKTLLGYYAAADGDTKVLNANGSFASSAVTDYITANKWSRDESPTTLYAHWRQNTYTVVFNKNDGGGGATGSMSNQVFTYGTAQNLTLNNFSWSAHNFEGWATTPGGSVTYGNGAEVNNLTTTDGATVNLYAVWTDKEYEDYEFTCVDISLVTEDSDPILVTSRNGINIMATKKLLLTVDGTSGAIDLASENNVLKFYKKTTSAPIRYVELAGENRLNAPITDHEVYVSYAPTTDGAGATVEPRITVTQGVNVRNYDGTVIARNLPEEVAIVAKVGSTWQALPANMGTAQNPTPVVVSVAVIDGVLKASGPSTISYKIWPVATTNSDQDRFGTATGYTPAVLYGDRLRFAGNSNKGLWMSNSSSSNTIANDGAITAIGTHFATDAAYEWEVTTTLSDGNFIYNLKANNSTNANYLRMKESDYKWGTYSSGNTNQLYILPLISKAPAELKVMEWGTNEIAISYPNGNNASAITAKIDNGDATEVTKTSLGGDIYKLTGVGDLQNNAGKTLTLDITESGSPKQVILQIPIIVTTTKTEAQLRGSCPGANLTEQSKVAALTDVIIRSGGLMTTGTASGAFKDLYIYPGGKTNISQNISLTNIYLRGGFSWLDAEKDYRLPQMLVANGKSISGIGTAGHGVYYDLHLDGSRYYMIAVPKDVPLGSITNEEGVADFTAWVKQYDGEGRTLSPKRNGWVSTITGNTLYRGVGYEMAIKPRVAGRTIGVLRMPLLKATAWTDETECTPSVTAWGVDNPNVSANNRGWNFIGAPFFTSFRSTDENGQLGANMEIRDMVHHEDANGNWTGTWDWTTTSDVKYVTIPQKMYDDYSDVRAKNYVLEAFYPFFIQAATPGNLSFTAGSKVLKAPSLLRTAVREREVDIDFMLSDGNGVSDQAGLTVGNEYSADFDMDDKEKTIVNENYLKVYTMVGEYRTAFNSLPEGVAELPIPVGYIAPKAGYYFFSMVEGNYSEVEHVWLTDYETSSTVDLLDGIYEFQCEKGTNNNRFVLNIVLKTEHDNTATGLDEVEGDSQQPLKFIYQDKMYIRHGGVLYDATGKQVREIK